MHQNQIKEKNLLYMLQDYKKAAYTRIFLLLLDVGNLTPHRFFSNYSRKHTFSNIFGGVEY